VYTNGPDGELTVHLVCNDNYHSLGLAVGSINQDYQFAVTDIVVKNYKMVLPTSVLTSSAQLQVKNTNTDPDDKYAVAYTRLKYPHKLELNNAGWKRILLEAGNDLKLLQISSFNHGNEKPIVYDINNNRYIEALNNGATVDIGVPSSTQERELILVSQASGSNGYKTVGGLNPIQFTNYTAGTNQGNYIILSNKKFFGDNNGNWGAEINDYTNYRRLTGYTPVPVDINEVYDQFGYGILRHSQAIRNLVGYATQNWNGGVKYMFIIGKGRGYTYTRNAYQSNLVVPTFGYPTSDNLLAATAQTVTPRLAIGRLAATTRQHIKDYLEKVRSTETERRIAGQFLEERDWTKRVIHLGGGGTTDVALINGYLTGLKNIITDVKYGAQVYSYFKNSTNPVQGATMRELDSLIADGTSFINFFGHSSSTTLDFNVTPENLKNTKRHFAFMALGCQAGIMHDNVGYTSLSERYVLTPKVAAIGFMANTTLSYGSGLDAFAKKFYRNMSYDQYGEGMGKILQETYRDLEPISTGDAYLILQTLTLHGDPAIALQDYKAPDYTIDNASYTLNPSIVTTRVNKFDLTLKVSNIGLALDTSFYVTVEREFPDGARIPVARRRMIAPHFQDTIKFKIDVLGDRYVGLNKLHIKIDADEEIAEQPLPACCGK
jgi:hypothetical protein